MSCWKQGYRLRYPGSHQTELWIFPAGETMLLWSFQCLSWTRKTESVQVWSNRWSGIITLLTCQLSFLTCWLGSCCCSPWWGFISLLSCVSAWEHQRWCIKVPKWKQIWQPFMRMTWDDQHLSWFWKVYSSWKVLEPMRNQQNNYGKFLLVLSSKIIGKTNDTFFFSFNKFQKGLWKCGCHCKRSPVALSAIIFPKYTFKYRFHLFCETWYSQLLQWTKNPKYF